MDACSEHNMRTVSGIDLPLDLSPSSPGSVDLFISDDPAMAKEAGLEIVFSGQNGTEPPALSVNGLPLHGLKSVPANSGSAFILSSKELREALKKGANRFELKSQTQTKLSSLSVRIEP